MERRQVLSIPVHTGRHEDFITEIMELSDRHRSAYVCFANVHMVVEAYRDASFSRVVNGADVVTPDGMPLALYLRWVTGAAQPRVCGMDLFPILLQHAERLGKSVFLYGTTQEVLTAVTSKAKIDFPALKIAGAYSPPFRPLNESEKGDVIEMINGSGADFIFVSLGCPKQEKWMAEMKGKITGCMLGLGQAFHVYAGLEKRLPVWMRNLSLEWAYRLFHEPRRLWKRYLVTNSTFLYLILRDLARRGFSREIRT